MPSDTIGYPPLHTPKRVADGVWLVDAVTQLPGGMPLPVRMTVVRLASGDLLLHSPTPYSPALAASLEVLGRINHLVAPSFGHWMFLEGWLDAYPEATTWAAPGLRERSQVRASGLRLDHDLTETAPSAWAEEIQQIVISGGPFAEVAMFHRPSRSLILTDLVQSIEPEKLTGLERKAARVVGGTAPSGKPVVYLRALLQADSAEAAAAAVRLIALKPERVIFAHGAWFETEGAARLKAALSWLLPRRSEDLAGRTVVITGASSGIGRAAAMAFASRGAQLVLLARRGGLLEEVAAACEVLGGQAIAVPTDVTDSEAVERAARTAEATFGRIDIWINNAGVGAVGAFHDTDLALHRRIIDVNLMGGLHGAASAVPRFIRQGSGLLINNISLGAWSPTPFAAAYTASKFGLRGLTASLRQELSAFPNIHVCGVFPAIVDTPGFAHGANKTGRSLDPGPFLYRPEQVAETFVRLARRPRAEVAVGWPSAAAKRVYGAAPRLTEQVINGALRAALSRAKPGLSTDGALLETLDEGREASGGWLRRKKLPSAHVLNLAVLATAAGLAATGLVAASAARARRR